MAVEVKSTWADIGSFLELSAANSKLSAMQNQLAEANELQRRQLERQIDAERRAAEERARYVNAKQAIFEERKRAEAILADETLTAGQKCDFLLSSWAVIAPIDEADFEEFRDKDYVRETRNLVRKGIEAFPDHALIAARGIVAQRIDLIRRMQIAAGYADALARYQANRAQGGRLNLSTKNLVIGGVVGLLLLIILPIVMIPLLVIGVPWFLIARSKNPGRSSAETIETARADFTRAIERHRTFQAEDPNLPDPIAMPPFTPDYTGMDLQRELANLYHRWGAQEGRLELAEVDLVKRSPEALAGIEPAPRYDLTSTAGWEESLEKERSRQTIIENRLMARYDDPIRLAPRTGTAAE